MRGPAWRPAGALDWSHFQVGFASLGRNRNRSDSPSRFGVTRSSSGLPSQYASTTRASSGSAMRVRPRDQLQVRVGALEPAGELAELAIVAVVVVSPNRLSASSGPHSPSRFGPYA